MWREYPATGWHRIVSVIQGARPASSKLPLILGRRPEGEEPDFIDELGIKSDRQRWEVLLWKMNRLLARTPTDAASVIQLFVLSAPRSRNWKFLPIEYSRHRLKASVVAKRIPGKHNAIRLVTMLELLSKIAPNNNVSRASLLITT